MKIDPGANNDTREVIMTQPPDNGEMPKAYEPGKTESKWYDYWMDKGLSLIHI